MDLIKRLEEDDIEVELKENIRYNYMIGGDGTLFEGRGESFEPEIDLILGSNSNTLLVAFLGYYVDQSPAELLPVLGMFFKLMTMHGVLSLDFKVIYEYQLVPSDLESIIPKTLTMDALRQLPNLYECNYFTFFLQLSV